MQFLHQPSLEGNVDDSKSRSFYRSQKFDPTRDAKKDIENAIIESKKNNKRILLDVGGEWCSWCHRLDSLFIKNNHLKEYLYKHYVVVKINVSKENENKEVLSNYPKVVGYPHLFILDTDGKLLHSQNTEALEYSKDKPIKGYDKEKVFAFLKKWTLKGEKNHLQKFSK